jgi:hypothetical protein
MCVVKLIEHSVCFNTVSSVCDLRTGAAFEVPEMVRFSVKADQTETGIYKKSARAPQLHNNGFHTSPQQRWSSPTTNA